MHIQVINFNLEGINRAEYETVCNELAEAFAALPGLISKHWLADDENNTYGGLYIWESKDAYEGYLKSDLFAGVGANPALANIVSKDFDVIEGPTRVTRESFFCAHTASSSFSASALMERNLYARNTLPPLPRRSWK